MILIELCICEKLVFPYISGLYTHPSVCHVDVIDGSKLKVEGRTV